MNGTSTLAAIKAASLAAAANEKMHGKKRNTPSVYDNWSNGRIANWIVARLEKAGFSPIRHNSDGGSVYITVANSMGEAKLRIADHKDVGRSSANFAASSHDIHPNSDNWKVIYSDFAEACKSDVEEYSNWE